MAFGTALTGGVVTIPRSVRIIGDFAFDWCKSLKEINIPDSVTETGKFAFYGCRQLTSITIPTSFNIISVLLLMIVVA